MWGNEDFSFYFQGNNGETDTEKRLMDMGRGEKGEMYGKSNMETYITICKIDSQREFAVWFRKLKQGRVSTWKSEVGEGGSKGRGYMYTYG